MGDEQKVLKFSPVGEWLCTHTGVLRSQYADEVIEQLIKSMTVFLMRAQITCSQAAAGSDDSLRTIPLHVLHNISEKCVPIIQIPRALQLVDAILTCASAGSGECRKEALSLRFIEAVASLEDTERMKLSYPARAKLWTIHIPTFQKELMSVCREAARGSSDDMRTLLQSRDLPRACADHPQLLELARDFFLNSDAPAELKSSFEQCLSGYSEVDMDTREV